MKILAIASWLIALLVGSAAQASTTLGSTDWITTVSASGTGASAVYDSSTSTLTLTSPDVGYDSSSALWYTPNALSYAWTTAENVTLSFNWLYTTADEDGSSDDVFGYVVDGSFYQLSTDGLYTDQSGKASLTLNKGDTFAFVLKSLTTTLGGATVTVSDFSVASAVPEPASWALALVGLGVMGWWQGRRSSLR